MLGYIVIARKRIDSKPEVLHEGVSEMGAENYAQDVYNSLQLDMVMVAEVNRDPLVESGVRMRKVLKIVRTCKHPNIQGELYLEEGARYVCMGCKMVFKPEAVKVISNIEISNTPCVV